MGVSPNLQEFNVLIALFWGYKELTHRNNILGWVFKKIEQVGGSGGAKWDISGLLHAIRGQLCPQCLGQALQSGSTQEWRFIHTRWFLELGRDVQPRCGRTQHYSPPGGTAQAGWGFPLFWNLAQEMHLYNLKEVLWISSAGSIIKQTKGWVTGFSSLGPWWTDCSPCSGHPTQELCFNVPEQFLVSVSSSPCWQYVHECSICTVFSSPCFLKVWLLDKNLGEFYTQVEQWRKSAVVDNVITQIRIWPEQWC